MCISSSEKMKTAKDEVGILIYEWTGSEFSGKRFLSHLSIHGNSLIDGAIPSPPSIVLPSIRQIESPPTIRRRLEFRLLFSLSESEPSLFTWILMTPRSLCVAMCCCAS